MQAATWSGETTAWLLALAISAARSITATAPLVNCTPPKMPSMVEEAAASAASSASDRRMASPRREGSARSCRRPRRGGRGVGGSSRMVRVPLLVLGGLCLRWIDLWMSDGWMDGMRRAGG